MATFAQRNHDTPERFPRRRRRPSLEALEGRLAPAAGGLVHAAIAPTTLAGDVDGDFLLTALDAPALTKLTKVKKPTAAQLAVGDLNLDGRITKTDLAVLNRQLSALGRSKPPGLVVGLNPISDPDRDGKVDSDAVAIVGRTVARSLVSVDLGSDGKTDFQVKADKTGRFQLTTRVVVGANPISFSIKGPGKKTTIARLNVVRNAPPPPPDVTPPALRINTAEPGRPVNTNVAIAGQATDDRSGVMSVRVQLDGRPEFVANVDAAGRFAAGSDLRLDGRDDGPHALKVRAIDGAGNVSATVAYNFTLDTTAPVAPVVGLDAGSDSVPVGDGRTTADVVALVGRTDPGLTVALVGTARTAAADGAGLFRFDGVALNPGANVFTTRAVDAAGNASQASATITRDAVVVPPPASGIRSISPAAGEVMVGPSREVVVDFATPVDPLTVNAASFYLSAQGATIPGRIVVSSTGLFATIFHDALPSSTLVRVTVDGNLIRDRSGRAIDADGDGVAGGTARADFKTQSLTRIPGTEVWGYIFDSYHTTPDGKNIPIVGATVRLDDFPDANAVTDATGKFVIHDAPSPEFFVHVDGSTATGAPAGTVYPSVGKPFHSVPGQSVQLRMDGMPFDVYLPPMAMADAVSLSTSAPTNVGFGPGGKAELRALFPNLDPSVFDQVKATIPAKSAYFDDGRPATMAAIIPVPPERLPAPLAPGLTTPLVISVQAGGATNFDVPVPVTFPNLDRLPAGASTSILSFDHDAGIWRVVADATVSADGLTVSTNPGEGIRAPGWHLTSPVVRIQGSYRRPEAGVAAGSIFNDKTLPLRPEDIHLEKTVPVDAPMYLTFVNETDGFVTRIRSNADGSYVHYLAQHANYTVYAYDPGSNLASVDRFVTGDPVTRQTVPLIYLGMAPIADADGEGLTNAAETAVGADRNNVDTDGDHLSDFQELKLGLDPLGGFGYPTGVIGSLNFDGDIVGIDASPLPDQPLRNLGFIALGDFVSEGVSGPYHGLVILDLTDPTSPSILGRVAIPGDVRTVAFDPDRKLAVVAAGDDGLFFVNVADPMRPTIVGKSDVRVYGLVLSRGKAYAVEPDPTRGVQTFSNDLIHVVDLDTGIVEQTVRLSNRTINDIRIVDDRLYVVSDFIHRFLSENVQNIPVLAVVLDEFEISRTGRIEERLHSLPFGEEVTHRALRLTLSVANGLISLSPIDLPAAGNTGMMLLRESTNGPTVVGQPGGIGVYSAILDGGPYAVMKGFDFTIGHIVSVLDVSDPTHADRVLTTFPTTDDSGLGTVIPGLFEGGVALLPGFGQLSIFNYLPSGVVDAAAPTVTLSTDAYDVDPTRDGIQVTPGSAFTVTASAGDDRSVRDVKLLQDGKLVGGRTSQTRTFRAIAPSVDSGVLALRFDGQGTDWIGNTTRSVPLVIEVVPDTFGPVVAKTTPAGGAATPSVTTATIQFNEPLDAPSLVPANFVLVDATGTPVPGQSMRANADGDLVTINYPSLAVGSYKIVVHAEAIRDLDGNRMGTAPREIALTGLPTAPIRWTHAGNGAWTDPANWDLGRVPGLDDDVIIDAGASNVVDFSGFAEVASIRTTGSLRLSAGDLIVRGTIQADGGINLAGGMLERAHVLAVASGKGLSTVAGPTSRLEGVTLDAPLDVAPGTNLLAGGRLTLNATATVGQGSQLVFQPGRFGGDVPANQAILDGTGTVRLLGAGASYTALATTASDLFTIGSGITVTGSGDLARDTYAIDGNIGFAASTATLDLRGTIVADQAGKRLKVRFNRVTGDGSQRAANGAILTLDSSAEQGTGPITDDAGSTVELGGAGGATDLFTVQTLGRLHRNGGTVDLLGTLDNSANTLAFPAGSQPVRLNGGTIRGGTISDTTRLTVTNSTSNTLEGVILTGDLSVDGGRVALKGAWTNRATIHLKNNARLDLGGTFAQADIGGLDGAGGSIFITGNLDNRGATLKVDASNGLWFLSGGRIKGGTIRFVGAGALLRPGNNNPGSNTKNVLEAVAIDGLFTLATSTFSVFNVVGGITLGAGSSGGGLTFDAETPVQTLSGSGELLNTSIGVPAGVVLTVQPGITLRAGTGSGLSPVTIGGAGTVVLKGSTVVDLHGSLTVDASVVRIEGSINVNGDPTHPTDTNLKLGGAAWANAGTITLADAILRLAGSFTSDAIGKLVRSGTTVVFIEGTLDNRNRTLQPSAATGSLVLSGGTILGGAIVNGLDGATLGFSGFLSRFDGVTNRADLALSSNLILSGAWRNEGTITLGANALLEVAGNFTLDTLGTIVRPAGVGQIWVEGVLDLQGGILDLDARLGKLVLRGTLKNGTVNGTGANTLQGVGVLDGVTLDTDFSLSPGGTLDLLDDLTLNGRLTMLGGIVGSPDKPGALTFQGATPRLLGTGSIRFNGTNNIVKATTGAVLTLGAAVSFDGVLGAFNARWDATIGTADAGLVVAGSIAAQDGKATLLGTALTIAGMIASGNGTVDLKAQTVQVDGTLQADPGGSIHATGNVTLGATSMYRTTLAGTTTAQFGRLLVDKALTLGGTLDVGLGSGYIPALGDVFAVATFATGSGAFAAATGTTLSGGKRLRVDVLADRLNLVTEAG